MTTDEAARVLAILAATFPSLRVDPELVVAWRTALAEADLVEVMPSVHRFIRGQVRDRNHAFAPSTAELLADVEAQRAVRDLAADESRKRLEASTTARDLATDDQRRAAMRDAGYTDQWAWLADRRLGVVFPPEDAAHRWFDLAANTVRDDREHPRPSRAGGRGGPATSLGDALRSRLEPS